MQVKTFKQSDTEQRKVNWKYFTFTAHIESSCKMICMRQKQTGVRLDSHQQPREPNSTECEKCPTGVLNGGCFLGLSISTGIHALSYYKNVLFFLFFLFLTPHVLFTFITGQTLFRSPDMQYVTSNNCKSYIAPSFGG